MRNDTLTFYPSGKIQFSENLQPVPRFMSYHPVTIVPLNLGSLFLFVKQFPEDLRK